MLVCMHGFKLCQLTIVEGRKL